MPFQSQFSDLFGDRFPDTFDSIGGLLNIASGGTYTNASGGRYLWDPVNEVLTGPYAANERATCVISGVRHIQIETASTNYMDVMSAWTLEAGVGRTAGQTDPLGGSTAFLMDTVGGGFGAYLTLSAAFTASATISPSIFFKAVTTTGTLNWDNQAGSAFGRYTIDVSALSTSAWTRLHRDHPAVTEVNPWVADGSGNAGMFFGDPIETFDFYAWWPQLEERRFVGSPIAPSASPVARGADLLQYSAVPDVMQSGSWQQRGIPYHASSDLANSTTCRMAHATGSSEYAAIAKSGGGAVTASLQGAGNLCARTVTWGRYDQLLHVNEMATSRLTVSGYASGDGADTDSAITWTAGTLNVGSHPTVQQYDGLVAAPEVYP